MTERSCVITDFMGDDPSLEEELLSAAGFDVFVAPATDPATWADEAVTADAILTRHAPIRAETIERLERCKVISRYGTGHDNIDIDQAAAQDIVVTNVPGYGTEEVADHTMTLLLMAARHTDVLRASIEGGGWTPDPLPPIKRLRGRRLGLLGIGRIGAAVAERAQAFGLEVRAHDPFVDIPPQGVTLTDSIDDLVEASDYISLHAPLTPDTHHVLDADRLARLPEGAIVINVARGGLLDLDAAIESLEAGHLGGVAIDVAEQEPLPPDHPARNHPGVFLTPHVGYFSLASVEEAKRRSVGEIIRVVAGEPAENPV